jgi:hypothetical protein
MEFSPFQIGFEQPIPQCKLKSADFTGEDRAVDKGILIAAAILAGAGLQVNLTAEVCIMHHNIYKSQEHLVNSLTFSSAIAEY